MLHPVPDPPTIRREFYSLAEIAFIMNLSVSRVRQFVRAGELRSHRLGGQIRIKADDFHRFLEERSQGKPLGERDDR